MRPIIKKTLGLYMIYYKRSIYEPVFFIQRSRVHENSFFSADNSIIVVDKAKNVVF